MGVFKKLKDVLFDVEEEEIPVITKEEKVKKEPLIEKEEKNPIKEVKIPKEDYSERELMKSESTFNFPVDDMEPKLSRTKKSYDFGDDFDDDFSVKPVKKEEPKKERLNYSKFLSEEPKKDAKKEFTPSPVISPVYGILDQNYTKDDVIVKTDIGVKGPDLDEVRKKAYGLSDKPKEKKKVVKEEIKIEEDEFTEPLKTLDEILTDDNGKKNTKKTIEEVEDEFTEPLPKTNEEVFDDELPDEPYADEKKKTDDTLETDIFNLIDSMYEDKNESEEEE